MTTPEPTSNIEHPTSVRQARCSYCRRLKPSSTALAFFEFCGEGSERATKTCKHCGYNAVAHAPEVMAKNDALRCKTFEPHGAFEFDSYYCGCGGWE